MSLELNSHAGSGATGLKERVAAKLTGKGNHESKSPSTAAPVMATFKDATGYSFNGENLRPATTLDRDGTRREIVHPHLTAELVESLTDRLHGNLDSLIGMRDELKKDLGDSAGNAEFDRLLKSPRYRKYGELYSKLTIAKMGSGGNEVEIDEPAMLKFMSTDKGIDAFAQLSKRALQEQAFAAAVHIEMSIPESGPRMIRPEESNARVAKGGKLHVLGRWYGNKMQEPRNVNNRIDPKRMLPGLETKGDVVAAGLGVNLLGTVAGIPLGPAGMVAGGALMSAAAFGIMKGLRKGESIELHRCLEAAQSAASDPDARIWQKYFNKLDPMDYENRGGTVQLKADIQSGRVLAGTRVDAKTLRDNLMGLADEVMQYQEAKGISANLQTPQDTKWLLEGTGQPPQHGTDLENRVVARMQNLRLDTSRRPAAIERTPGSGDWIANPAFDSNNIDIVGNLARYDRVWDEEFQKDLEQVFRRIEAGDKNAEQDLDEDIKAKKEKFGPEGELAKDKLAKIEDEIGENKPLKKDAATLSDISTKLEAFKESLGEIEEARHEKAKLRARVLKADGTPFPETEDIRSNIEKLANTMTAGGEAIQIDDHVIKPIATQLEAYNTAVETYLANHWKKTEEGKDVPEAPTMLEPTTPPRPKDVGDDPTVPPGDAPADVQTKYRKDKKDYDDRVKERDAYRFVLETYNNNRASYDKKHAAFRAEKESYAKKEAAARRAVQESDQFVDLKADITADRKALKDMLTALATAEENIKNAQEGVSEKGGEEAAAIAKAQEEMHAEFREMREEREHIEDWNGTGGVDLSRASIGLKSVDELNKLINQANKADSKVGWPKEANGLDANRQMLLKAMIDARLSTSVDFEDITDPGEWGISEFSLITMEAPEIKLLMEQRNTRLGGGLILPSDAAIDDSVKLARSRFEETQKALRDLTRANQVRTRELESEKAEVVKNGVPLPKELAVLEELKGRYPDISAEINNYDLDLAELLDDDEIDRTDPDEAREFAKYEDKQSKSFVRMMQIMLDHRHGEDVKYEGEKGPEAAFKRNTSVIQEEELARLLAERFNLVIVRPVPRGTARSGGRTAFDQVILQMQRRPDIAKKDLALFLTEDMIFKTLRPLVQTL